MQQASAAAGKSILHERSSHNTVQLPRLSCKAAAVIWRHAAAAAAAVTFHRLYFQKSLGHLGDSRVLVNVHVARNVHLWGSNVDGAVAGCTCRGGCPCIGWPVPQLTESIHTRRLETAVRLLLPLLPLRMF